MQKFRIGTTAFGSGRAHQSFFLILIGSLYLHSLSILLLLVSQNRTNCRLSFCRLRLTIHQQ
ncbi:hypothetical protein BO86DRAFT_133643 [Aspergillus japonicus CBS 114.51]|uniref:Uncharacterized protein n=1 Tax=Aspergillus japonicus CBS 114.51 TaxID=1448312 RepID=A0A8T8WXU8_ASPJA|nr:hypothetical protein BO86DRAFT_133643 [Aspergillus japonicus CBS 114.51]RAH80212.1 hypothetical protein BO86DRAFT_133643 [Aspergillus japonicus CBS 114.51]